MNALLSHLVLFAKLMSTVVCESYADPQSPTVITIDHNRKIGIKRLSGAVWSEHILRNGMKPAPTIG